MPHSTQNSEEPAGTDKVKHVMHLARPQINNGRYTYWQSRQPIPGGVAFENFELRERFFEGQTFVFGLTRKTPLELGWAAASIRKP